MENIKVEHLAKTVYDNQEDFGNKFKKQEHPLKQKFLNDIKQKDLTERTEKTLMMKTEFGEKNSKENVYVELHDLRIIATSHLSYLDEVRNIQSENVQHLLTGYLKSEGQISENKVEPRITTSVKIEKTGHSFDFYSKNLEAKDRGHSIDLELNSKKITGIPSEILKKNILITKSELFIRNFHGDQHDLLKNIKRQLPDDIDRIWLNGKMVWSKT